MTISDPNTDVSAHQVSRNETDVKKIVLQVLRNWYWFVFCLLIAGALAFFYNRYTTPLVRVQSNILMQETNSSSPLSGGMEKGDVFQGFSSMGSNFNLHNQMAILKSKSLISRVVDALDFEVSYYIMGDIIVNELYGVTPFIIEWDVENPQLIGVEFMLQFNPDGSYMLTAEGEDVKVYDYYTNTVVDHLPEFSYNRTVKSGERVGNGSFAFTVSLRDGTVPDNDFSYMVRFNSREQLVNKYKSALSVLHSPPESSILLLSVIDENALKSVRFLNTLAEVHQQYNLEKKNENANRTIRFITSQLENVSDSLVVSADMMQDFQSENKIIDISAQTGQLLVQVSELDKERVALETKDKYYKYLRDYIKNNQDLENIIAPSAMGIEDPLLNSLIAELNQLVIEKSSMTSVKNAEHPKLKRLNAQIESAKSNLLENMNNIISQSELALRDVKSRQWYYEKVIKGLPATEREYVNIERKYALNNEIYTFLLEKLSEAQIAKASNTPNSQVVESAEPVGIVQPNTQRTYAIALSLGIVIPLLIIFLRDFFNTRVSSSTEVREVTTYPFLGNVYRISNGYKGNTLVLDRPTSPLSEPYRAIAHKLSFYGSEKNVKAFAVTSSIGGEGKTFNAVNLASSYALSNKRTVLLDLDLRRSTIADLFKLPHDKGLVFYLLGRDKLEDIVFNTKHPNLDVIPAGPIPPNPAELINSHHLKELFRELKEHYDVIIADTSPVGIIADMIKVSGYFDAIVFVTRQNYTHKTALKDVFEEIQAQGIENLGIIMNFVTLKRKKHGYGYGYGYADKGRTRRKRLEDI
jgi:capsular exopolysaccharide synthesis family protein